MANHLRADRAALGALTTSLVFGGGALAAVFMVRLFDTPRDDGLALLAIAVAYGLAAVLFFARRTTRDLSALLAAAAFTVGAFAVADLFDGRPLAYAWAAEAAAVAWLSRRVRELRFQVWAGVYLLLTLAHVLILDAPPTRLFVPSSDPARGALTAVAFAAAACVFAFYARPWTEPPTQFGGVYRLLSGFFALVRGQQRVLRGAALWSAGILATYAASLGILALFSSFDWGWVAVTGLWSVVGLGLIGASLRHDSQELRTGSLAWLGAAGAIVVLQCVESLAETPRSWAFLVLAGALLVAAVAYQLLDLTMRVSAYLATASVAVGAFAAAGLLSGQPLAYAWAAEAAALAFTARRLKAPYLQTLALAPLGPRARFTCSRSTHRPKAIAPRRRPSVAGALTMLAFAAAAGVSATEARSWRDSRRQSLLWASGLAATYTLSSRHARLFSSFDWGYVALAAIWSAIGLALWSPGCRSRLRSSAAAGSSGSRPRRASSPPKASRCWPRRLARSHTS